MFREPVLILVAIFFSLGFGSAIAAGNTAYTPPIGIPVPSFGLNEVAPALPSPWNNDVAGFYYIKSGGSNSGNGFPGNPRNAIPNSGIPAGSVVVIEGEYNTAHSSLTLNGNASAPIFIVSSSTAQAIIKKKWEMTGRYFIMDGVNAEWDNSSGNGKLVVTGSHVAIKNGVFRGDTNKGIGSVGISNGDNILFYKNTVRIAGDWKATEDQDTHAMSISTNISYLWVLENSFSRSSGDGIQINAANSTNQPNTHHIYIGRNVAFENKQNGFWTKQATDVIFSENEAYNHIPSGSSPGVGLGQQYGPENVWYLYNKIHDNYGGITIASRSGGTGENVYIIGNQIYDNNRNTAFDPLNSWSNAAITSSGGINVFIVNNTLENNSAGIHTPTGSAKFVIQNNIIGAPVATGANSIFVYESSTADLSEVDNNLFNGNAVIRWGRSTQDSLSSFQATFGLCQNCEIADPMYVDSGNDDYDLLASSPAIDSGLASPVYQIFQDAYGIDIRRDAKGLARPQGSAWDSGAFEYSANILPAPSGLVATAVSTSQIDLSWTDNSNNEDGMIIEYSTDAGNNYSELASLSADASQYSHTGLGESTTVYYRVFAYNGSGNSAYSNASNTTTQASQTLDTAPPVIALVGANPQEISLGGSYTEQGASATDNIDGDISDQIVIDSSAVDTQTVGTYTVTYNVDDAAGNSAATVVRSVNVVAQVDTDSGKQSGGGALNEWVLLLLFLAYLQYAHRIRRSTY